MDLFIWTSRSSNVSQTRSLPTCLSVCLCLSVSSLLAGFFADGLSVAVCVCLNPVCIAEVIYSVHYVLLSCCLIAAVCTDFCNFSIFAFTGSAVTCWLLLCRSACCLWELLHSCFSRLAGFLLYDKHVDKSVCVCVWVWVMYFTHALTLFDVNINFSDLWMRLVFSLFSIQHAYL